MMVGYLEVEHPKLTWWKRMPEEHEGLVRNQEGAPRSHSIMALRILGKDELQVQFLLRAPINLYGNRNPWDIV